jgi:hypothetical protein
MPTWLAEIADAVSPFLEGTTILLVARLSTRLGRVERHLGINTDGDPPTTLARAQSEGA